MVAVLAVITSSAIHASATAQTGPGITSQDLPVSAVTASEHDGNIPENTRDNNLTTRWSAEAIDRSEWIRYDLGTTTAVHYLNIAWYQGDQRRTRYQIQTSNDATTWTTITTGESSGTTLNYETYDFPDTTTRYIQILSDGNTTNDWVSITEVNCGAARTSRSAGTTPLRGCGSRRPGRSCRLRHDPRISGPPQDPSVRMSQQLT